MDEKTIEQLADQAWGDYLSVMDVLCYTGPPVEVFKAGFKMGYVYGRNEEGMGND